MKSLPRSVAPYQRTREFNAQTIPSGLRRSHRTKSGSWARIHVLEGTLRYRILEPVLEEHQLTPGVEGIIEPSVSHEVEPVGDVRFYVEYLREPGTDESR